jgi:hypothetical protein
MEIDGDTVHQSEEEDGLQNQLHDSCEAVYSNDEGEELDAPAVLFESEGEGYDSEEEEDDEDKNYESEPQPELEDDLELLLTTLENMQSNISFLAFPNCRHKTPNELGCLLYVILLQIPIEYKRYVI